MDRFADLEAFIAVVDAGSFSAAGERLGVAKSMVSRRVSQLEQRLGSRLMHRTTRHLAITDAGRYFYERGAQVLADLADAEQGVAAQTSALQGTLKLAAPLSFGLNHLSDALAEFMAAHPDVRLNLDLNDRHVNLVEEGFDMAVRIGELSDSNLIARRVGTMRTLTCASPGYIERYGEPGSPEELNSHFGLQYSNISYRQQWRFELANGRKYSAQPEIRLKANNGEVLAAAAVAGLGIVSGPSFILGNYLKSGRLVSVLVNFRRPETGIHLLYPPGRLVPRRVQVLSDFLAQRFGDRPYWDEGLDIA